MTTKTRTLLDGRDVPEKDKAVTLEVYTRCPEKWMLVDLQTGERYIGHDDPSAGPNHWKRVNFKDA
jgi:hypothetical protein